MHELPTDIAAAAQAGFSTATTRGIESDPRLEAPRVSRGAELPSIVVWISLRRDNLDEHDLQRLAADGLLLDRQITHPDLATGPAPALAVWVSARHGAGAGCAPRRPGRSGNTPGLARPVSTGRSATSWLRWRIAYEPHWRTTAPLAP